MFGSVAGAILSLPAVLGELFWSASILAALGTTLAVIIELPDVPTIIVSAAIAEWTQYRFLQLRFFTVSFYFSETFLKTLLVCFESVFSRRKRF